VGSGRNGKGTLIHSLTDAAGMPLAARTAPANGDERAQVLPLLDTLWVQRHLWPLVARVLGVA
jgi:transposase